jgi:ectoine hydroxylase-related dioxygenase (phytanoyl-CoA dioxygenase family)
MSLTSKLYEDGYVVLPDLISEETCDKLRNYLEHNFNEELPYNYFKGHYQINLPKNAQDFPEEIVFNNHIHDIIGEVLGKSYNLYSYTCNANLAQQNQPYHMDCSHYHPINTIKQFGSPGPPVHLIANIYLQNTDITNGSFEIVPGSHLFTEFEMDEDGIIDNKYIEKTVKCDLPKGSIIIRDKRTWHRGTENTSNKVRYMVSTGYSTSWYKLNMNDMIFEEECRECFNNATFSTWNINFKPSKCG